MPVRLCIFMLFRQKFDARKSAHSLVALNLPDFKKFRNLIEIGLTYPCMVLLESSGVMLYGIGTAGTSSRMLKRHI